MGPKILSLLVFVAVVDSVPSIKYGKVFSLSYEGKYCAAEGDFASVSFGHPLSCNRDLAQEWEMLCFVPVPPASKGDPVYSGDLGYLLSYNWGRYCSVEEKDRTIRCNRESPAGWELVTLKSELVAHSIKSGEWISIESKEWNASCVVRSGYSSTQDAYSVENQTINLEAVYSIFQNRLVCNSNTASRLIIADVSPEKFCSPEYGYPSMLEYEGVPLQQRINESEVTSGTNHTSTVAGAHWAGALAALIYFL